MLPCLVFLGLLLSAAQSQDVPPSEELLSISDSCNSLCSCEAKDGVLYLNCEQRNISKISQIKIPPGSVFHLNLYRNDLVELQAEEMEGLRGAVSLHIGGNSIQELEPGVFSSLGTLKKLHINSNFLVTLKEDTFQGLENLEFLQADTNFIRVIESGAFNKLIRLKVLILNDNSIESLPKNIFRFVPLTHLDLRGNKLQTLPYMGFLEHIGRIMELLLEDNDWVCDCDIFHLKIWMENMRAQSVIGDVVCSAPQHLKGITLAKVKRDVLCPEPPSIVPDEPTPRNGLAFTPAPKMAPIPKPTPSHVGDSPCMERCYCHNNHLTGLLLHCQDQGIQKVSDIGILQQSPTKLVMTGNMIQTLFKYDFVTYDSLEVLNLANNRIDYIDNETFLSLSSLKKLYLNGNQLEKLFSTMFVGLHNLEYLYLEYNNIKEIAPGTFNPLPNLKLLSLNNNQLKSLPAQIFRNVPLAKLNLRQNLLEQLPVSNVLDQLDSLEQIYLEDNPWDCGCESLGLKQWLEKLRKDTVVGSILCQSPKKVAQKELRNLSHDVLCPDSEGVSPTEPPKRLEGGLFPPITDTIPLSVLILSLLVFVLMIIFCSAGLVVFVVHRRRLRAKKKAAEEPTRENANGSSPIHLHYSMYGQKTTHHHTVTQRTGTTAALYDERSHSPIVQICRNPTYCAQHKGHDADLDYGLEDPDTKRHLCRSIMEKENTSPLTGNAKYRPIGEECPAEFVTLAAPNSLYRNLLGRDKELQQQLGLSEYFRKNLPQLQPAVDVQIPGRQEELQLMEAIMYTRPRKVTLEQTKNEYFELKANLHSEPDYLEVLEHQTAFN